MKLLNFFSSFSILPSISQAQLKKIKNPKTKLLRTPASWSTGIKDKKPPSLFALRGKKLGWPGTLGFAYPQWLYKSVIILHST